MPGVDQARWSGRPATRGRTGRRPSSRSCPRPCRSRRAAGRTGGASVTWSIVRSSRRLARPTEPVPERHAPVVEDLHRDAEALAGLAEHVLRRDADVLEVQRAEVVAAQAHRVVGLAGLEALHPLLEDERDVAVLAVRPRRGRRRRTRRAAPAVADPALLAVEHPRRRRAGAPRATRCCRRPSPRWARSARSPRACGPSRGRAGSAPSARRCRTWRCPSCRSTGARRCRRSASRRPGRTASNTRA